jgi:hypothetical protein
VSTVLWVLWELVRPFGASTIFVLALFIGFCVLVGFAKTKKTAGGSASVVKSLDERLTRRSMAYLPATAPRGPADPLEGFGTRPTGRT